MSNKNLQWIKDPIVKYIEKYQEQKLSSIDIIEYFRVHDSTIQALSELVKEGRITRHNHIAGGFSGAHHYTVV